MNKAEELKEKMIKAVENACDTDIEDIIETCSEVGIDYHQSRVNAISDDEILLDIICQWENLTEKEDIAYAKQFVEDYKNSHRFNKLLKQ